VKEETMKDPKQSTDSLIARREMRRFPPQSAQAMRPFPTSSGGVSSVALSKTGQIETQDGAALWLWRAPPCLEAEIASPPAKIRN
jgi:hypothetical protein